MWKVFGLASRAAHKYQSVEVVLCEDLREVHFGQLLLNVLNVPSPPSAKRTKFSCGLTTFKISSI
jgi:hypothetical protein